MNIKNEKFLNITPEQKKCLDFIRDYGCIVRYEAGFWGKPNDPLEGKALRSLGGGGKVIEFNYPIDHIGPTTVLSLLKKNLIKVTKTSENGKAIECVFNENYDDISVTPSFDELIELVNRAISYNVEGDSKIEPLSWEDLSKLMYNLREKYRKEIIKAWNSGRSKKGMDRVIKTGDQYFNENYKKK